MPPLLLPKAANAESTHFTGGPSTEIAGDSVNVTTMGIIGAILYRRAPPVAGYAEICESTVYSAARAARQGGKVKFIKPVVKVIRQPARMCCLFFNISFVLRSGCFAGNFLGKSRQWPYCTNLFIRADTTNTVPVVFNLHHS